MPASELDTARVTARRALAWSYSCKGWTVPRIAALLEVSEATAYADLAAARSGLGPVNLEHVRQAHIEQIRIARERLFELAMKAGAPLVDKAGEIIYDPETNEVARDLAGPIAALNTLVRFLDREAKVVGSDAAMKVDVSGEVAITGPVDAELEALAAELRLNDEVPVQADA